MMKATSVHQTSNAVYASRQEPCLLCGREDWCSLIKDEQGKIYKVLCHWTDQHNPPEGWQYVTTARDGRPTFVKLGYQRKHRSKRYPDVIELKPQILTDVPQWQDVQIPVEQVERGHAVLIKPELGLGNPETIYEVKEIKTGKRSGQHTILAVLTIKGSPYGGTLNVEFKDLSKVVTHDPETGAKEQYIEYRYSEDFKEVRHHWTDRRKVYNGESKKVRPYRRLSDGSWTSGKGDKEPCLYRYSEAKATINSGGIVFAVGGPQAVEWMRSLGLVAICNQGGEGRFRQIAQDLASTFAEAIENELKPLLVSFPDHDETGQKTFGEGLPKECYKHGISCVTLDPLTVWSNMPPGGDAKDWIEHCQRESVSPDEMHRQLEFAIDEAIDHQEEEIRLRWQREAWNAPVSHKGEIGRWVESSKGESTKKEWKPLANFDFVVERELKDSNGGGLVLQLKRSFDKRQYRIIINSTDYTSVDKFVDALKAALGTGIVCNLTKHELGALIHTRLHEYRTNRSGKVYKRIDRYGQQEDGTWVFRDRQYTHDGKPTSESETSWVFSDVSAEGDEIPCPELAPENPAALKNLVDAARKFFGQENFHQVILLMGWGVAGLHSQAIFKDKRWFPPLNAHGEPGSCKTLAGEATLSLFGFNWAEKGMLARSSPSAIYEHGSRTGGLPFIWDDPDRNPQNEEIVKNWANWKARVVRGNRQEPHSPIGLTSNHVFGSDQAATYTRIVRLLFKRAKSGSNASFQELQAAQKLASGAFPMLLQLGYPRDEIAGLERELLPHLPLAHARVAQSLAIVTYYAQAVVNLIGGSENVLQWVISNICHAENDTENAGDSLQDFIAKIQSLEGQNQVGDWNKQIVSTSEGREWVAIHAEDVWGLVDRHFNPATYNKKSLKALVLEVGGKTDSVQRFATSRDEVLTYYAAEVSPRQDRDGNEIPPNPPRNATRKAWLLPIELFDGRDNPPGSAGDGDSDSPPPSLSNPSFSSRDLENNNPVTAVTNLLPKTVTSQNLDGCLDSDDFSDPVTTVTKKIDEIKTKQSLEAIETADNLHSSSVTNSGNSGNTVTAKAETQSVKEFHSVTDSVTESRGNLVTREKTLLPPTLGEIKESAAAIAPEESSAPITDPMLEHENLELVKNELAACVRDIDSDRLWDLRQVFSEYVLRAAVQLLTSLERQWIKEKVLEQNAIVSEPLKVGDRVWWDNCPGHCSWMNPFIIMSMNGDLAALDGISCPVQLSDLKRSP